MTAAEQKKIAGERLAHLRENVDFDYIYKSAHTAEFSEFIVEIGGDVITYRVYASLAIVCK